MTREIVWFVLSGFVMGFIVSTLWEWLYYRGRRIQWHNQRVAEQEARLFSQRAIQPEPATATQVDEPKNAASDPPSGADSPVTPNASGYRSQAALLRSEQESNTDNLA